MYEVRQRGREALGKDPWETRWRIYLWCTASPWMVSSPYPPAFLRQASRSALQFQHVPVALSLSSLLAYIKHLAVSSRRALKAGWPRSEVTIQESCILKGFAKILGLSARM